MFDLLAQVDPMSLPLWAVLAFSAAMYPLGFMLGAPCSACCDGCPAECDYCAGPYMAEFSCDNGYISLSANGQTVSASFLPGTTDQTESITLATYDCDDFQYSIQTRIDYLGTIAEQDDCGCKKCRPAFTISAGLNTDQQCRWYFEDQNLVIYGELFDNCTTDQVTKTYTVTAQAQYEAFAGCLLCGEPEAQPCCDTLSVDDFSDVVITVTAGEFAVTECECGACCLPDNSCKQATQYYCELYGGLNGTWQGVGTDCDPDPCPQLGACCVNGECYQATDEQCGVDGGAWQAGACEPSPC